MQRRPVAFVIEDQHNLLMLYEDALRLVGYDVVGLRDGLSALNKLETTDEPPAFIILDINLPGLSGRDIHKHIRSRPKYQNMPVIILTANSLMAHNLIPEMTQHDHLYVKPISMRQLQELAKMMRPNTDGVPDYMADTQKVPHLDIAELNDAENLPVILRPDDSTALLPAQDEAVQTRRNPRIDTGILRPDDTLENAPDAIKPPDGTSTDDVPSG